MLSVINRALRPLGLRLSRSTPPRHRLASDEDTSLIDRFAEFTMTGTARQYMMMQAVRYVDQRHIPGDIVECGVWRGGVMMLAKATHDATTIQRNFHLFDTFAGMTVPTEDDVEISTGRLAGEYFKKHDKWCYVSLEEVQGNFRKFGLLDNTVVWHKGKVEETLKSDALPSQIALLRLDTDWYESTAIEMAVLYPLLQPGGVLIIDDYGTWAGSRKAVDEALVGCPLLHCPVDGHCVVAIKT